ncbi:AlpA family transcriptional regulator [Methylosinus sp. RM1]|uniref:helix-turn-helix transcriptional regulator n=1 Tax=Methylosinus sp. RM1 TaxID=2583817 RepID=UPI00140755CF|nr:hypothetical protein [Methylosinus sp. RM1]
MSNLPTTTDPTATRLVYDAKGLAAVLGVSRDSVDVWSAQGVLPKPLPLPGRKRWSKAVVDAWLASNGANVAA